MKNIPILCEGFIVLICTLIFLRYHIAIYILNETIYLKSGVKLT